MCRDEVSLQLCTEASMATQINDTCDAQCITYQDAHVANAYEINGFPATSALPVSSKVTLSECRQIKHGATTLADCS